jgi:hypothetical protein
MIDFRSQMLLRILTDAYIAAKGAQLEWPELDTNQLVIANTLARLEYNAVYGADAYNALTAYTGGQTYYRTYAGNVWKFISASTQTGIAPGSNPLIWELSSIGVYAHQRGTDTQLMSSGGIVITGDQILAWILGGGGGGGSGSRSIEPQTINAAGTAIAAPAPGFEKLVELNVATDTQYTGLPAPSATGKIYNLKEMQGYNASFSVAVDGITAGQTAIGPYGIMQVVDLGTYKRIG